MRAGIERAVDDYRARGFVMSIGEWQRDVNSVGVPLIPTDGGPILAFNCGAPAYQLSREAARDASSARASSTSSGTSK